MDEQNVSVERPVKSQVLDALAIILQWLLGAHQARWLNCVSSLVRHALTLTGGACAGVGGISHDNALVVVGSIVAAVPTILSCARHFGGGVYRVIATMILRVSRPSLSAKASMLLLLCISVAACSSINVGIGDHALPQSGGADTNACYTTSGSNVEARASVIIIINQSVPKDIHPDTTATLTK